MKQEEFKPLTRESSIMEHSILFAEEDVLSALNGLRQDDIKILDNFERMFTNKLKDRYLIGLFHTHMNCLREAINHDKARWFDIDEVRKE